MVERERKKYHTNKTGMDNTIYDQYCLSVAPEASIYQAMSNFDESLQRLLGNLLSQNPTGKKVNQKVVDGVLSLILQSENNPNLEQLEPLLDNYLLPLFTLESTDTNVLLIAVCLQSKINGKQSLNFGDEEKLHSFLIRSIQLFNKDDSSYQVKSIVVKAVHVLFLNLHDLIIRKQTASFVSILTWSKIQSLESLLKTYNLEKQYSNQMNKTNQLSSKEKFEKLLFSSWIPSLLSDIIANLKSSKPHFDEFMTNVSILLINLLGQLPTRRFMRMVVLKSQAVPIMRASNNGAIESSIDLLEFYIRFPINEFTGELIEPETIEKTYSKNISKLQVTVFHSFKEKLGDLAFATYHTFKDNEKVFNELNKLTDDELDKILESFEMDVINSVGKAEKIEALIFQLEPFKEISSFLKSSNILPTEQSLTSSLHGSQLILPDLKAQYLSMDDFLVRTYLSHREDYLAEIAQHVKRTLQRFDVKKDRSKNKLTGSSKHAVKTTSLKFSTKSPTTIESRFSVTIEGDVKIDLNNISHAAVEEWNRLDEDEIVLLVKLETKDNKASSEFGKLGLASLRSGVVKGKFNNNGEALSKTNRSLNLRINLDAQAFSSNDDLIRDYEEFNLIIKLPPHLSDFNVKLNQILKLMGSCDDKLPEWFYESFLGFGDANAGCFENIDQSNGLVGSLGPGYTVEELQATFNKYSIVWDDQTSKRRKTNTKSSKTSAGQKSPFMVSLQGHEITLMTKDDDSDAKSILNPGQLQATVASFFQGLIIVDGAPGTGKKSLIAELAKNWGSLRYKPKTLIVSKSDTHLNQLFKILRSRVDPQLLFNMSDEESQKSLATDSIKKLHELLRKVDELSAAMGLDGAYSDNIETANSFFKYPVHSKWIQYLNKVKQNMSLEIVLDEYPFSKFGDLGESTDNSFEAGLSRVMGHYSMICGVFDEVQLLGPLEFLQSTNEIVDFLFTTQSQIIGVTAADLLKHSQQKIAKSGIAFENLIVCEAPQLTQFETLFPLLSQDSNKIKRIALIGDPYSLTPTCHHQFLNSNTHFTMSLISRLKDSGAHVINLNNQYNRSSKITSLLQSKYPGLINKADAEFQVSNAGVLNPVQFVTVEGDETQPITGVYLNIQEAEYSIQLYQYFRLLGYPRESISVLTPEKGQDILLKEVASTRCGDSDASDEIKDFRFGSPHISTVQDFRGGESEIVIFSSVRSLNPDDRLLTAALSSAKRGFYMFGSPQLLDNTGSSNKSLLSEVIAATNEHELHIVVGEMYSSVKRLVSDDVASYKMENLEHFDQFVQQMTEKRLEASRN